MTVSADPSDGPSADSAAGPSGGHRAALLEARGLTRRFGALTALDSVDFIGHRGQVHALTGANGAGKSTLMNLLAGVHAPTAGEIRIDGKPVRFASPAHARATGISAVYQELTVLPELTVAENIWLGREPRSRWGLLDRQALFSRTSDLLAEYGLSLEPDRPAGSMSVAGRQVVEIARALSASALVLTLDEPTAVLSEAERTRLFDIVGGLKARGLLVLFVSHRLDEVFEISDHVTVLRNGKLVASEPTSGLDRATLVRHMVGHDVDERTAVMVPQPQAGETIEIEASTVAGTVQLRLAPGEIVGFGGLVGAGRTRLARRIGGLDPQARVDVRIGKRSFRVRSAADAIRHGIVYLTEDRKRDGLFLGISALRNASATALSGISRFGLVDPRTERRRVKPLFSQLKVVTESLATPVRSLSGGNQQKVLFARALLAKPALLICDEPTRGVDVGSREDIYLLIEALAREGVAILLISSDLKELLALSHRVLVVRDAMVVAELGPNASEHDIVAAAVLQRSEAGAG